MKNKIIFTLFGMAFLCWLLPFAIRIFFIEMPIADVFNAPDTSSGMGKTVDEVTTALAGGDNWQAFMLIMKNNLKGCVFNMAGGVLFGIGTLVSLVFNGFFSADMFAASYDRGTSIASIFSHTLPHSIELVGFWLSGAIGFYIAWNVVGFIRGKEAFNAYFYKQTAVYAAITVLITILAAYIEAYISIK